MRFRTFSTEGVVLSRKNYGEADRILTVYSKHFGKIRLLAKGVRRPKSRKRGHVEIFSRIKFSVSKGNGLDLITEAELVDSYDEVRRDLKKIALAYYLCEVLNATTREDEKNSAIFEKIVENLELLATENNLKEFRKKFVFEVLVSLGFWPREKTLLNPDFVLEEIVERKMNSARVGKIVLT